MNVYELPNDGRVFVITGENGSGKTRWLERYSHDLLLDTTTPRRRLLCLSGTVMDKFPLDADKFNTYAYFGRRTSSNMFSEIAPYRKLITYIDAATRTGTNDLKHQRGRVASAALAAIGLEPTLTFRFRRGRNSRDKLGRTADRSLDISISLSEPNEASDLAERTALVSQGLIHTSGVTFKKGNHELELMDLSSGERNYVLTIFALAFGVTDQCTVLFDEPENSLHPKWQARIMRDMWQLISTLSVDSQLVVATHSPLVVSGSVNSETYVLDLTTEKGWTRANLYGNAADVVLKRQFGLESPRSMSFVTAVQDCVDALLLVDKNPDRFRAAASTLFNLGVSMDIDDPLYQTVEDIRTELERLS